MPIQRSPDQKRVTLEEFYTGMSKPGAFADIGKGMLKLLKLINETFTETLLWGTTFQNRLVIQAAESGKSEWLVIIGSRGVGTYFFEYLLPEEDRPWPNATVHGMAKDLGEAKLYLLIAMNKSKGWTGNEELERLLTLNGIN